MHEEAAGGEIPARGRRVARKTERSESRALEGSGTKLRELGVLRETAVRRWSRRSSQTIRWPRCRRVAASHPLPAGHSELQVRPGSTAPLELVSPRTRGEWQRGARTAASREKAKARGRVMENVKRLEKLAQEDEQL